MLRNLAIAAIILVITTTAANAYSISSSYTPPVSGDQGDSWSFEFSVASGESTITYFDVFIGSGIDADWIQIDTPPNWTYTYHYSDTEACWIEWSNAFGVGEGTYTGFGITDIVDTINLTDAPGPDSQNPAGGLWYAQLRTPGQSDVSDAQYTQSGGHVPVTPEPSTLLFVGLGLASAALLRRR